MEVTTVRELIESLDAVIVGSEGLSLNPSRDTLTEYGQGCFDTIVRIKRALEKIEKAPEDA